mmetsp:Transcript_7094/g.10818  ORF Transcript_7094/g.10818 Transcript_7094/m.10818 type:complete len:301 (-) Transcript_7094:479-1381(-)
MDKAEHSTRTPEALQVSALLPPSPQQQASRPEPELPERDPRHVEWLPLCSPRRHTVQGPFVPAGPPRARLILQAALLILLLAKTLKLGVGRAEALEREAKLLGLLLEPCQQILALLGRLCGLCLRFWPPLAGAGNLPEQRRHLLRPSLAQQRLAQCGRSLRGQHLNSASGGSKVVEGLAQGRKEVCLALTCSCRRCRGRGAASDALRQDCGRRVVALGTGNLRSSREGLRTRHWQRLAREDERALRRIAVQFLGQLVVEFLREGEVADPKDGLRGEQRSHAKDIIIYQTAHLGRLRISSP